MPNFMKRYLNNKKGNSIIAYVFVFPSIMLFVVYLVLAGSYFIQQNHLTIVASQALERTLVNGSFTSEIYTDMIDDLETKGFASTDLFIDITPGNAQVNPDYVGRGDAANVITLLVRHEVPHPFYHVNKALTLGTLEDSAFKLTATVSGMSEKW